MTKRFIVRCLVATSLTVTWYLVSLSENKKEGGEHLLWLAMSLCVNATGCRLLWGRFMVMDVVNERVVDCCECPN